MSIHFTGLIFMDAHTRSHALYILSSLIFVVSRLSAITTKIGPLESFLLYNSYLAMGAIS